MQHANVKLSKNELALVTDMQVILTKNLIIEKVYMLFGLLSDDFQQMLTEKKDVVPPEALSVSPKISKGEQYRQLPYVVLDCPRFYTKQHVLAIRCFFWWGNFFSITLHLAGKFLEGREERLANWMKAHSDNGWHIGVNAYAWEHHFDIDNYVPLQQMVGETNTAHGWIKNDFLKLAKKMPIEQWDNAIVFFEDGFRELLCLLEN